MIELHCGDCLDIMPTLDKPVDLVFTDLPYGTTNCRWDSLISLPIFWGEVYKLKKVNAAMVMFSQSPFDKMLAMSNIKDYRYEWIWEKNQATGHLNAKRCPMKAHENILVFYEKLPTYNPQKTSGHNRKVSTAHHKRNTPLGSIYNNYNPSDYDSTNRYPRSVIKFSTDKQKLNLHSTQKPLALCEYIIKTYSSEGDTVLDPCMGSASIGVACKNLNRNYIGIEKDVEIFNTGKQRLQ